MKAIRPASPVQHNGHRPARLDPRLAQLINHLLRVRQGS